MKKLLQFTVPGEARGKGRPRFVRATGRVYTPEETLSYEHLVKVKAQEAMDGSPPFEGPLGVAVGAWRSVPASWSKKRRAAALLQPAPVGFDADNIAKSVLDAMNGVVFHTSAITTTPSDENWCVSGALPCGSRLAR